MENRSPLPAGLPARHTALKILMRMERQESYSNLLLDAALRESRLPRRDADFVTALVYGVLERRLTLDYLIDAFAARSGRMKPAVCNILRLGACQLLFMDRVPPAAAVNESVALARAAGCGWASGFVNAVLRAMARRRDNPPWPDRDADEIRWLSVRYSCPEWLVRLWRDAYGSGEAAPLLAAMARRAPTAARVNTLRTSSAALVAALRAQGVEARPAENLPDAIEKAGAADVRRLPAFEEAHYNQKDYASQLCCRAVDPQPGETVLDMCAAPGGKSFTMALRMQGRGLVRALELHPRRAALIEQGARRLGLANVRAQVNDSSRPNETLGLADRVLCDVPCSGLGVIRRKPEIRFKKPETFDSLPNLQYSILYEGSRHVRPGGILVYSTCTLNPEENEALVIHFMENCPEFVSDRLPEPVGRGRARGGFAVTLFPHRDGTDGFFIARMKRNR